MEWTDRRPDGGEPAPSGECILAWTDSRFVQDGLSAARAAETGKFVKKKEGQDGLADQ